MLARGLAEMVRRMAQGRNSCNGMAMDGLEGVFSEAKAR
jgi:hypothetical protein